MRYDLLWLFRQRDGSCQFTVFSISRRLGVLCTLVSATSGRQAQLSTIDERFFWCILTINIDKKWNRRYINNLNFSCSLIYEQTTREKRQGSLTNITKKSHFTKNWKNILVLGMTWKTTCAIQFNFKIKLS